MELINTPYTKPKKKKVKRPYLTAALVLVLAGLIGGIMGAGI